MISGVQELAEHDVSWLAIRHPAVMRLLERELAAPDGDAFAAGLELACRILGGRTRPGERGEPLGSAERFARRSTPADRMPSGLVGSLRLDHNTLNTGLVAVRAGRCDRAMVRSIRDQIEELPVALTPREHDAVATVIAAIIWSVLDASARELDDTLVA